MKIVGGSLNIGDGNFIVNSSGEMTAKEGVFKGDVQAKDFLNKNGISMMNNDYQFESDYLSLYGLEILNKESDLPSLTIDDEGNIEMGTGANLIARGGTLVGSTFIAADATDADIVDGDIADIDRLVINKYGLVMYDKQNRTNGINLRTTAANTLEFYKDGLLQGVIQGAAGNITLHSEQRIHIRGASDTLATGKWQFGNSSLPADVDFENAKITGLRVTFG